MRVVVAVAIVGLSVPASPSSTGGQSAASAAQATARPADPVAAAYDQFLLGRHLESGDDIAGAVAAFKRAMALDPNAADIPAELAALYMRQSRAQEALDAAGQALKLAPANREAHRVAGTIYAALADAGRGNGPRVPPTDKPDENVAKAIQHLEAALDSPVADTDPNTRAALSRLYLRSGAYTKAIPLLSDLVAQEPGWQEGPLMLAEAYSGAGRAADGIAWLERAAPGDPQLYPTLADFYERERRWKEAADAYARALEAAPRSAELQTRYASALLNTAGRDAIGKARDVLTDVVSARPNDQRVLYLLAQAQRRLGDATGAEATARRVIALNAKSPWGYYALAEALEERHQYQAVVDALAAPVAEFRSRAADVFELGLLLPQLGFAYQELGQVDKALPLFEEAHRLAPDDIVVAGYLIQANISAKKYAQAAEVARQARAGHPDNLPLARLEAQALRQSGKADQGIALLEGVAKAHADDPSAYVALAQLYSDAERGAQALQVLRDAQTKFPADDSIPFELGAVLDKQKRFADAEAAFKQVLARDPENAAALNYLGYMLAEHGERLDESVTYIKKALQIEPDNGSFLDSLGWAYFKADKLDLAEENLKRAAGQLTMNSVIQDHYGDVLSRRGHLTDAIAAWTRALTGDGDSIDRAVVDKKIRTARQKLGKK